MAAMLSLASLEYNPERGRPSYRGVPADEVESFNTRRGIRLFVPDVPGMDAGEISAPGIDRLQTRFHQLWTDLSRSQLSLDWGTQALHTQYLLWDARAPQRLVPLQRTAELRDAQAFRNFVAHGAEADELLIALTDAGSPQSFAELVRALACNLFTPGEGRDTLNEAVVGQPTPEEAARMRSLALRDELLALNWPTSAQVARMLGSQAANAAQYAARKRNDGKLFGVWSIRDNTYVHPDFQFDHHQQLHPELSALLAALSNIPGMSDSEDRGGWRRAFWLYGATAALSDRALGTGIAETPRAPADVFGTNPKAVIDFAGKEAMSDPNVMW